MRPPRSRWPRHYPAAPRGCLESITVNIVESLCKRLRVPFERRPVDRSELLVADEIALAGTLMEIGLVKQLEGRAMPADAPLLTAVADLYWACVRAETTHPDVRLTPVSFAPRNAEELENAGS